MSLFQCGVSGMFIPDPGFRILLFSIPDTGFELSPSRIPDPHQSILTSKKAKNWFLSSKKYDPGCSSRIPESWIRILTFSHKGSWIQGSKRHPIPDPGSATLIYFLVSDMVQKILSVQFYKILSTYNAKIIIILYTFLKFDNLN
jgi:hypothetical protein